MENQIKKIFAPEIIGWIVNQIGEQEDYPSKHPSCFG